MNDYKFQVLDPFDPKPGVYMFKNGEWVEWDKSGVNEIMTIERKTFAELKKVDFLRELPEMEWGPEKRWNDEQ